ncbi:MAG: PQQ-dependent sugar dehydrogenase [Phycisphaerales bacterium]|nr:PQQ-dependent sugar dehydrogenase [Phycisphaerales bacterium]
MAFAPDGRLFVAERLGAIRVIKDGELLDEPFAELEPFTGLESGLLGITLDPNFAANGYVYAFLTATQSEQIIVRLTDIDGVGAELFPIRGAIPTTGELHNGGGMRFGPDGMLYFSVGDTGVPSLAQDVKSLAGSICRINPDGTIPDDNPFKTPTNSPRAAYAFGFRNPYRFCFSPDGRLFAMDIGSDDAPRTEEVNLVVAGGNYGWPLAEGPSDGGDPNLIDPIFSYHELGQCIAGCVVYPTDPSAPDEDFASFPETYRGNLFHLDFVNNALFRVRLDGDKVAKHELFHQAQLGPLDLALGPDGALYYCEFLTGDIQRVRYAAATASPTDEGPNAESNEPLIDPNEFAGEPNTVLKTPQPQPCGFGAAMTAALSVLSLSFARARNRLARK